MIEIRQAIESDFNEYLKLRKKDKSEYSKIIGEKINIIEDSKIRKEFDGMLKSEINVIFVAEENNFLIGYLCGSIVKNVWQYSGYVDDVFVISEFKRQGIGKNLIETFMKFLKSKKIKKCRLGVNVKNMNAIKLYEKLGFKIYSYEMSVDL